MVINYCEAKIIEFFIVSPIEKANPLIVDRSSLIGDKNPLIVDTNPRIERLCLFDIGSVKLNLNNSERKNRSLILLKRNTVKK